MEMQTVACSATADRSATQPLYQRLRKKLLKSGEKMISVFAARQCPLELLYVPTKYQHVVA